MALTSRSWINEFEEALTKYLSFLSRLLLNVNWLSRRLKVLGCHSPSGPDICAREEQMHLVPQEAGNYQVSRVYVLLRRPQSPSPQVRYYFQEAPTPTI